MLLTFSALCLLGKLVIAKRQLPLSEDLYLEVDHSGDIPIDDTFSSGSGSGYSDTDDEDLLTTPDLTPTQHSTQMSIIDMETFKTTATDLVPDIFIETKHNTGVLSEYITQKTPASGEATPGMAQKSDKVDEVQTENLFQRTEVLAAVIAGGVIGFLFATFLILLLVYRMRKKDEGSYDLGERKVPSTVYQKAPTKEFYA